MTCGTVQVKLRSAMIKLMNTRDWAGLTSSATMASQLCGLRAARMVIMSTSDAPFGWRHALVCAAIIAATAAALVLGTAHAQ